MMLIETSAAMIADLLPATRSAMDIVSSRFNQRSHYRWQRIIDFLKLHYCLSERQESFWRDASSRSHLSEQLQQDLELWKYQAPWIAEFDSLEEPFPSASYQYVLYGMGYHTQSNSRYLGATDKVVGEVAQQANLLSSKVQSNRSILELING